MTSFPLVVFSVLSAGPRPALDQWADEGVSSHEGISEMDGFRDLLSRAHEGVSAHMGTREDYYSSAIKEARR